jgi:aryl-alcohol dehydrogenase-like predicted oxidoreductase
VRYWGLSNFEPAQIRQMLALCAAHGWPRPVVSQPRYNWLDRGVEVEHLPLCARERIAVTPYQPLAGGLLTGKYRRGQPIPVGSRAVKSSWLGEPDEAVYDQIEAFLAEARGEPPARYAIRWLLGRPAVASVVAGTTSIEQLAALV